MSGSRPASMLLSVAAVLGLACDGSGNGGVSSPTAPMIRDSLSISSAEPPAGAVIHAYQPITISVVLAYQFATAQGGKLHVEVGCFSDIENFCNILHVQAGSIDPLSQASGSLSYNATIIPQSNSRFTFNFKLTPEGAQLFTASAIVQYRSDASPVPEHILEGTWSGTITYDGRTDNVSTFLRTASPFLPRERFFGWVTSGRFMGYSFSGEVDSLRGFPVQVTAALLDGSDQSVAPLQGNASKSRILLSGKSLRVKGMTVVDLRRQ